MDSITVLGSTGSIGTQALEVLEKAGTKIAGLSAHNNINLLETQIRKYKPSFAAVSDEKSAELLKIAVADTDCEILAGQNGVIEAAADCRADTVLNAIVGIAGFLPTLAAIDTNKRIALANKETLVAGGEIVMKRAGERGVAILPVDSEHSAIFQCLQGVPDGSLKRILLTASGGPFFGMTLEQMENVTVEMALDHPNWDMGGKITIDSATMMNKGLELIEAMHLFNVSPDDVQIIVHRQSIVHSMIELNDNSVLAQLGMPDMRIPIQYALFYPECREGVADKLDLFGRSLTFEKPDLDNFPCLAGCIRAAKLGGLAPAFANGANEAAVGLFLGGKIGFNDIGRYVAKAVDFSDKTGNPSVDDILAADREARQRVYSDLT